MRHLALFSAACLAVFACGSCRREAAGQTGLLLALATDGPADCVTIREAAAGAPDAGLSDAGTGLSQQIDAAAGLPAAFSSAASFRTAKLTVLIYSGGKIGDGAFAFVAEGHRGSCSGPVVSRYAGSASFLTGQVTEVPARLALLGRDLDGDGYAEPEDCNDADPTTYPGAPALCDGKDHACSGAISDCRDPSCAGKPCDSTGGICHQGACAHETNCADGIDNDGDGKIDCADPDCTGKRCASSGICQADGRCAVEICTNKIDDNGDGKIDCEDAVACPAPAAMKAPICCAQAWTDGRSDVHHCGTCGNDCTVGHSAECGSVACTNGACVYGSATDGQACSAGLCCRGNCVPNRETSCSDRLDNNCDGLIDCQDPVSCPAPGAMSRPACCDLTWVDRDKDPLNCGGCGKACPAGDQCHAPTCAGGTCGLQTACANPGCDGQSCKTAGGAGGVCGNGVCCAGCVGVDGTCQAGTPTSTGACCAGCVDGAGACHAISAAFCGVPGGTCNATSCDDGNACTADSCTAQGTCSHANADGTSCTASSGPGVCEGGACCGGCVDHSALCQAGTSILACGAAGALCQQCAVPSNPCKQAVCGAGQCGTANKPDGTVCGLGDGGLGACKAGTCAEPTTCPTALCNGVCCNAGESCQGSGGAAVCACDLSAGAGSCASAGGCCSTGSPSRCLQPAFDTCAQCGKTFCSACASGSGSDCTTGACVSGCASGCGLSVVSCGGPECLIPTVAGDGPSGQPNICSEPGNAHACQINGGAGTCDCTLGDPTSCPGSTSAVCRTGTQLIGPRCGSCGSSRTDGQPCKGGGTCQQSSGNCR